MLSPELVIVQGFYGVVGGEEKKILSYSKRETEENAELNSKLINRACEFTSELKMSHDVGSRMRTVCSWES